MITPPVPVESVRRADVGEELVEPVLDFAEAVEHLGGLVAELVLEFLGGLGSGLLTSLLDLGDQLDAVHDRLLLALRELVHLDRDGGRAPVVFEGAGRPSLLERLLDRGERVGGRLVVDVVPVLDIGIAPVHRAVLHRTDELVGAMQDRSMDGSDPDVENWDDVDDETAADTLAAIEQSLEETWTASAFEDDRSTTTIPVEMYQLSEGQQEAVMDRVQLIAQVEQAGQQSGAETAEELQDELGDEAAEMFDSLGEIEDWLDEFLADVSASDALDRNWWGDHDNYPGGLRMALFMIMVERYQDRLEGAQSFRGQR